MKLPSRLALLAALAAGLAGCDVIPAPQPDLTRYYLMSAPEPRAEAPAGGGTLRIGLRAVAVPAYLKGPEMVVRRGANEVVREETARWAEPIEAGVGRALRAGLRASPAVAQVWAQPFPLDQDRDYDVSVEVVRCEGAEGGGNRARFSAVIEVSTAGAQPRVVARREFEADSAWDGKDFAQLAAGLGRAAAKLGSEAAAALPAEPPKDR